MSFRGKLASRWLTVVLAMLAGWLVYQSAGMFVRVYQAGQELARLEERSDELSREISRLEEHLERTDDPAWLEYQARLRLNYRYPDEKVVVVYKKENSGTISSVASPSGTVDGWLLWDRLREWFSRMRD